MNDNTLSRVIKHIGEVVHHPDLYLRELLILVCMAVLVVFICVVFYALLQVHKREHHSKHRKHRAEPGVQKKAVLNGLTNLIGWRYLPLVFFSTLTLVMLLTTYHYGSGQGFCVSCHEMEQIFNQTLKTSHAEADCNSCHQRPGISGILEQNIEYAEMIAQHYGIMGKVTSVSVPNQACMGCHGGVYERTIISGAIRVEHKQPQDAGYSCTQCHFEEGLFHADVVHLEKTSMNRCMNCHDGGKASALCSTCHVRKSFSTVRKNFNRYSKAKTGEMTSCRACHEVKKCLNCHEIQLPHESAWKDGGHAYNSFISPAICFECHAEKNCLKCHEKINAHGKDWRKKHGKESKKSGDPCMQCHDYERFCMLCHDE
jgi:hypothetical protein